MATLKRMDEADMDPRAQAVLAEIRELRGSDFINNLWLYLAQDPPLLEEIWGDVRDVVGKPSALDPLVKEMIYVAVSMTNACDYCVHSHTAAAKAKGMTPEMHADLLRVASLASRTNALANGVRPLVDGVFDADV